MIGNDIVDLNLAKSQSNWQRKGFLDKIFTKKEQKLISRADDSFRMAWLLWSMKESACKIYSRQNNVRFYAPRKFECEVNNLKGTVTINNTIYFTKSTISSNCIYTIATVNTKESITTDFFKLENSDYSTQHSTSNNYLKSAISNQYNIPISQLKIEKDTNGVPDVNCSQVFGISLSHHGHFGAYAFI